MKKEEQFNVSDTLKRCIHKSEHIIEMLNFVADATENELIYSMTEWTKATAEKLSNELYKTKELHDSEND